MRLNNAFKIQNTMKRLLIILALVLSFSNTSKATHTLGGEIGWTCLANGKYIFYMTFYRDCTGISYAYEAETLTIYGSPLPENASGSKFSTIIMNPDSNRWIAERNGDTSPTCTNQYGNPYTCDNGDPGTMQQFFYTSAPITLAGNPSRSGWRFFWESRCCRPGDIENMITPGPLTLRAEMFRTRDREDKNPCIDSSPEFRSLPTTTVCRGYEFTYNSTAIDSDLDSLIYSWDRPYNGPGEAPVPLVYKPGYAPNNPTPDKTFDVKNIASTLNPLSGVVKMAVYSGVVTEKFMTVIQVDAYRDKTKIASVYREIPVSVFTCPNLPNGKKNNPPEVFINGVPAEGIIVNVTAGQEVRIPIQVKDLDITGIGTQLQEVTVVPDGLMFTRDRTIGGIPGKPGTPCQVTFGRGDNLVVEPCAYLQNKTPFLDAGSSPPERKITGLSSVSTEFVWQTDCKHIQNKTGVPGTREGIYNFVLRVSDDHCPIPAINYPTITVRVKDPFPLTEPIMKGIHVDLNGDLTYQWVPAIDSAFTFEKYLVERAAAVDGVPVPANNWNILNANLKDFQQEEKDPNYNIFRNVIISDPNSPKNILNKVSNRDWYMRMTTVSGCTDDVESDKSEQVRIIETNAVPSGVIPAPLRSSATLSWNRPKPGSASTKDYFHYESKTHFYIWENDSISNGGVGVAANWYLRGNTTGTTFSVESNICADYVGLRVEARDTVITWKQGNAPAPVLDSLDTLVFSTFSVIDTLYMVTAGALPRPKLDTIEVKADGSVYFRVNRAAAGTAGSFNIYSPTYTPANLIGSIGVKDGDSLLILAQGANSTVSIDYIIEAVDICNPTVSRNSFVYQTIVLDGNSNGDPCIPFYTLTWNAPTGFTTLIKTYQIYTDTTGTGNNFELSATVDGLTTTADILLFRGKLTLFKVVATDQEGAVNISATREFQAPSNLRSDEIVPPPSLRCTFVEDGGNVILSFIRPSRDSTLNGTAYEFQFRRDGGNWQNFAGSGLVAYDLIRANGIDNGDTAVQIIGINAQTARYDFRARMLSGCSGSEPSAWSNTMSSIFVEATAVPNDKQKKGNVVWNATGVDYGASAYDIFKDTFDLRYTEIPFARDTLTNIVDDRNRLVCFGIQNYYVKILDEQSGCISRSNIDSALYVDNFPPDPLKLDYISFGLNDGGLDVKWSTVDNLSGIDSLFFTTTDGFNSGLQAYRSIGETTFDPGEFKIPFGVLDARDSAVVVAAITQDGCGNRSSEADLEFHKSMDVEVDWFVCDSSMNLSWNPYVGFNENFDVVYTVYFDSVGNGDVRTEIPESVGITDTTFSHKIEVGDKFYHYYVRASSLDPAAEAFESNSNIDSAYAIYEDEPRFGYLTFATVEDNVVKLEYHKDKLIPVKGYNIYRGTDKLMMNQVGYVDFQSVKDDDFFDFTDGNVDVNSFSYFYKIEVLNACDEPVDTSNHGRSILLGVSPDNEAITNTLRWNEYEEWDSTVAYYNIYRGVDVMPTNNIYAVVPPSQGNTNLFVDDVYDDLFSIGKFCYRVDAIQGAVSDNATNGIPNNLDPAVSSSNVVCITQEPLFYVPNAFAPDGVNRTFGPKGQFFDFSLFEMVIFNRWGEEIYRTRDINKGWDGSFNGEQSQLGTYVYTIRFIDADGEEHRRKGTVTLVK